MTIKEYEVVINMLMAQGRKLYAVRLMKEASGLNMGLKECKEHLDEVFIKFKERLQLFKINDYSDIYTKVFKSSMRKYSFNIEYMYFFNTNGELVVTWRK